MFAATRPHRFATHRSHRPFLVALLLTALLGVPRYADAKCTWSLVASPNGATSNYLSAVSGSSTGDVWAVGQQANASGATATLTQHFDGSAWSIVAAPNPGRFSVLRGVVDISPTNAWAVGVEFLQTGGNQGLLLLWNGSVWTQVPAPTQAGRFIYLNRVAANSVKDVWAVGGSFNASGSDNAPATMHYNGKKWAIVNIPNVGSFGSTLTAVTGTSKTDEWAIGDTAINASRSSYVTLAEHWDGKKWSVVPTPNANSGDNVFNAAVSVAPNDVWAIGDYYTGSIFDTLTEHWNGSAWSIIKSPTIGTYGDALTGAAAFSTKAVWAVGSILQSGEGFSTTLSLKWNGKKWAQVKTPNLTGGNPDALIDAAAVPGSSTLWAAGSSFYPSTGAPDQTLTAANACASSNGRPLGGNAAPANPF
jgi:hypothetical protein